MIRTDKTETYRWTEYIYEYMTIYDSIVFVSASDATIDGTVVCVVFWIKCCLVEGRFERILAVEQPKNIDDTLDHGLK